MPARRVSELLSALSEPYDRAGEGDPLITGVTSDSRRVRPGYLFVAIPGHTADGHRFIPDAIANGAVGVVAERPPRAPLKNVIYITVGDGRRALAELCAEFYENPTRTLFTVGITGTKGKTSAAHFSAAVLEETATELISTVTNALERDLDQTTPAPEDLQGWAFDALRQGKRNLVIEVSAHALHQRRVHAVDFDVAVFTSFSHDHLDYFRDLDEYLNAKLALFRGLAPSATAIVHLEDPAALRVLSATRARTLTYGRSGKADIWADDIELSPGGTRCRVHTPWGSFPLSLRVPGPFMLENALAAVGVGLVRGLPLERIQERLEGVESIPGRLEIYAAKGGFTVAIDFAHSPDSLERVLRFLKEFYPRVIVVFGCGGDSDRLKRPLMGAIAARLADYAIITSDNPKGEHPRAIIQEIEMGLLQAHPQAPYEAIPDRRRAIERALALAQPGDCVLIAGKGHERFQVFRDKTVPFNDFEFLVELGALERRPDGTPTA